MLYIFHKQICWTWEGKSVETSLLFSWKMVHYAMSCHGFGENVKPGADALKQTLKAITYVICIMQHNASALTWYAVHQQVSPNCPMSQYIAPFYVRRVYYQGVIWNRCMESVIDARGGVIYATESLASGTQQSDPPKYLHIHKMLDQHFTHTSTIQVPWVPMSMFCMLSVHTYRYTFRHHSVIEP